MPQPIDRGWQLELRTTSKKKLEIAVHDIIGQSFFEDGITSKKFLGMVRSMPDATDIDLRINSIGGVVDDAKGMVNLLAERAAAGVTITGYVDGIAASAASYLLTAAHRVVMPSNAFQMVHQVHGGMRGTADDLEERAALMRRMNEQLAEAYAAASARRGKGKTKEDFLATFAKGDTYLDADEAIDWGLADEKLEPMSIAACLVDLEGIESAPEALRSAPYVITASAASAVEPPLPATPAAKPTQLPLPGVSAQQTKVEIHEMKNIIQVLALNDDADEAAVTAAIKKLQTSARVGAEVEKLVSVSGDAAIGAVRALREGQTQMTELAADLGKVKAQLARRDFESARDGGLKDRKLTPATAKMYSDRFEAALASGADGSGIVADLQGFLAVAPRVVPAAPTLDGKRPAGEAPLQHNGKTFAQLAKLERSRLSQSDPELYALMRDEWVAAGKPAA